MGSIGYSLRAPLAPDALGGDRLAAKPPSSLSNMNVTLLIRAQACNARCGFVYARADARRRCVIWLSSPATMMTPSANDRARITISVASLSPVAR
jgi:hypothetical protein